MQNICVFVCVCVLVAGKKRMNVVWPCGVARSPRRSSSARSDAGAESATAHAPTKTLW